LIPLLAEIFGSVLPETHARTQKKICVPEHKVWWLVAGEMKSRWGLKHSFAYSCHF